MYPDCKFSWKHLHFFDHAPDFPLKPLPACFFCLPHLFFVLDCTVFEIACLKEDCCFTHLFFALNTLLSEEKYSSTLLVSSWLCCFGLPFFLSALCFTKMSIASVFCKTCGSYWLFVFHVFLAEAFQYKLFVPHIQFCLLTLLYRFCFSKHNHGTVFLSYLFALFFVLHSNVFLKLKILTFSWSDNAFFCQSFWVDEKEFYILLLLLF